MQAAAKSQREATNNISVPTRPSINGPRHNSVQAPKVIAGPQIMGKGNNKIDIAQVQDYLNNLKMQNAAASASHSNSTGGILKISNQGSTQSGGTQISGLSGKVGQGNHQIYSRSTSRGKEHASYSQAIKLSAMLGKPSMSNFIQPISAVRQAID